MTAPTALSDPWCRMDRVDRKTAQEHPPEHAGRRHTAQHPARLPDYAERVLEVAEIIPPGRVMTYGDVAEWLGEGGPRQVGRAMALYGGAVPWWRVVRADGRLLPGHEARALAHYREEATPLRDAAPAHADAARQPRIDMRRARWDGDTGRDDTGRPLPHN
ncbi:MGMT family protein [Streptomyces sp. CC53]|uniref:MGMT family protein n=1 Tax=unclassified Streptomyces TaxID=2593676 RepID=UPI000ABFAC83